VNDRLRAAMLRAEMDPVTLGRAVGVDAKTVTRWVAGRMPHRSNRLAVATALREDEGALWPAARPDQAPGSPVTGEVVSAYGHRADVPQELWLALLRGFRERLDVVGYSYSFLFELVLDLPALLAAKCAQGARVRLAILDPDCDHVRERDALEQLGGTLAGRVRTSLNSLAEVRKVSGVSVGLHAVHLYNAVYLFDDQMIVTPYLYRARGYQHPALHMRRLSPFGVFHSYAEQFEQIWGTVRVMEPDD
jgi:hypothetical protein